MMIRLAAPLALLLSCALGASEAAAQSSTTVGVIATAAVKAAVSVEGRQDLAFGQAFTGHPRAVAATDPTAGQFAVRGDKDMQVSLAFLLPTTIGHTTDPGERLSVGSWSGRYNSVDNNPTTCGPSTFTPSFGGETVTLNGSSGRLFVCVGGTIVPVANQRSGSYAGLMTLVVSYTGL